LVRNIILSKSCTRCGVEFAKKQYVSKATWSKAKFCSRKCRKNPTRNCAVCGKDVHPKGLRQLKTQLWCSRKCRYSYPTVDFTTHEYRTQSNIRIGVGKRNANSRSLPWKIDLNDYKALISKPCFYCGNKLGNVQTEIGAGLDRLVNSLGYTKENVIPCCGSCNRIRSDIFTVEETKVAVEAILRLRNF